MSLIFCKKFYLSIFSFFVENYKNLFIKYIISEKEFSYFNIKIQFIYDIDRFITMI